MSMDNTRQIKSYVWHDGLCYFVSTIERSSSAASESPRRYNETIVWQYDWEKQERGDLLGIGGDARGSIGVHAIICERIYLDGFGPDTCEV